MAKGGEKEYGKHVLCEMPRKARRSECSQSDDEKRETRNEREMSSMRNRDV